MNPLTDSDVLLLAKELNHILWTEDSPQLDASTLDAIKESRTQLFGKNMQCVAHAIICAAIILNRGEIVVTRGGSALVIYPELKRQNPPYFVMKHWWLSTKNGLCDLSMRLDGLSKHKPVVYLNRNLVDPAWKIIFRDNFASILKASEGMQAAGEVGVLYQTDKKKTVTRREAETDLNKFFDPAQKAGIPLTFGSIVNHCEELLSGGPSMTTIPQIEAWRTLQGA